MGVAEIFKSFCNNLIISSDQRSTISRRYKAITNRLNIDFWGDPSETLFSRYVGSYGRNTAIKTISDIDMIFVLPNPLKQKYDDYSTNGQSALLQSVKASLKNLYYSSSLGADGQIIAINFSDGLNFEVLPAFQNENKSYTYPDSNSGGSWKKTDPHPEIDKINSEDPELNYNLKRLCKMTRAWKGFNNVPMGGLLIDTLAYNFLKDYYHRNESYLYYDFMARDFFKYLKNQDESKNYWLALGSYEIIWRKGNFEYKAKLAYNKTLEAIELYKEGKTTSAQQKWREIYGYSFPG